MNRIQHLPASARQATLWKNGGGVTREVGRQPPGSSDAFQWRISIAEVSKDGPFSRFTGYRRLISVIDGQGMQLDDAAGGPVLLSPFQPHEFDGAADIYGSLPHGPVSDLNVIFQPDAVRASMRFSERSERLFVDAGATVLVMNTGTRSVTCMADGQPIELASLDALKADAGAGLELPPHRRWGVIELRMR